MPLKSLDDHPYKHAFNIPKNIRITLICQHSKERTKGRTAIINYYIHNPTNPAIKATPFQSKNYHAVFSQGQLASC